MDDGAAFGRAFDHENAVQPPRSFAHPDQVEMADALTRGADGRVDPDTIVADADRQAPPGG